MRLPASRALMLFSCISAAFAQNSDNSTSANDADDGKFGSPFAAIFFFFFVCLFVPLSFLMLCILFLVRIAGDVAAYCCGYRILPEERRWGEPYIFRDRETGRVNAVCYTMVRYRTPDMSDEEESYAHLYYRQIPANNNESLVQEQQQDQHLVLLVPTCCPRYARVSSQWSWLNLIILPMVVVMIAFLSIVNGIEASTAFFRTYGMSTAMTHTFLLVVYGGTALWAFLYCTINAYCQDGWSTYETRIVRADMFPLL